MFKYLFYSLPLLFFVSACAPVQNTNAPICDPNLASCSDQEAESQFVYLDPVPVDRDELMSRVDELKRWLKWQRAVSLGETDQPFEPLETLISGVNESSIRVEPNAEERLIAIQQLADSGETGRALDLATELMEVDPDRVQNLTLYTALLTRVGRYNESMLLLDRALSANPQVPEFYNNQAVNYAAKGDIGKAMELLQTAFSTHPSFAQIQFNLKQLYQATARRALAPLEDPPKPELNTIELHFELEEQSKLAYQEEEITP